MKNQSFLLALRRDDSFVALQGKFTKDYKKFWKKKQTLTFLCIRFLIVDKMKLTQDKEYLNTSIVTEVATNDKFWKEFKISQYKINIFEVVYY